MSNSLSPSYLLWHSLCNTDMYFYFLPEVPHSVSRMYGVQLTSSFCNIFYIYSNFSFSTLIKCCSKDRIIYLLVSFFSVECECIINFSFFFFFLLASLGDRVVLFYSDEQRHREIKKKVFPFSFLCEMPLNYLVLNCKLICSVNHAPELPSQTTRN